MALSKGEKEFFSGIRSDVTNTLTDVQKVVDSINTSRRRHTWIFFALATAVFVLIFWILGGSLGL